MSGIGGRTVEEAKQRLSYAEFCSWLAYRRKRGTFHQGLRQDRATGLLATIYANAHRKKDADAFNIWDFLPYEDEPPMTLEQAMEQWK